MTNIAKIYEIRIKKSLTAARSFNVKRHLSRKVIQDNYDKDYYYMRVYLPVVMAFLKDVDVEYHSISPYDGVSEWWLPIKARTPIEDVEKELDAYYVAAKDMGSVNRTTIGTSADEDNKIVETDPDALHISTIGTVPAEEESLEECADPEDYEDGYDDAETGEENVQVPEAKDAESALKEQYQLPPAVNEDRPVQQVFVPQREYKNNNNQNQRNNNGHHNNKQGNKK